MLVYLASSLSNRRFNAKLADLLTAIGCACFLPQRDAPQDQNGKLTVETNIEAISRADLVLVIGKNLGNDTSWEAGFAKALGKSTVLLCAKRDRVDKNFMLFFSADKVIRLSSYSRLESKLPTALKEIVEIEYGRTGREGSE